MRPIDADALHEQIYSDNCGDLSKIENVSGGDLMYKGSNAEKLNNMCLYDLLCRMAKNTPYCIIETVTGKAYKCPYGRSLPECDKCIAAWLNEEAE